MTERIALALLAAGRSRRFGVADKLEAALDGRRLIDWAAAAGREIDVALRFAVTAPDSDPALGGYQRLINASADEGMGASLRLAARAAREAGANALLVLLADMPFVGEAHLRAIIAAGRAEPARPVFSRAPGGAPQPPALFPSAFFEALEAMTGDTGARALAAGALIVEAQADSLADIDTPEDLAQILSRLHQIASKMPASLRGAKPRGDPASHAPPWIASLRSQ